MLNINVGKIMPRKIIQRVCRLAEFIRKDSVGHFLDRVIKLIENSLFKKAVRRKSRRQGRVDVIAHSGARSWVAGWVGYRINRAGSRKNVAGDVPELIGEFLSH